MSERLPSIDGDISSGAVVFGNPEKKADYFSVVVRVHPTIMIIHQFKDERKATTPPFIGVLL